MTPELEKWISDLVQWLMKHDNGYGVPGPTQPPAPLSQEDQHD